MTAASEPPKASGVATGIADTDRVGANTKAQAANPINKSLFMQMPPPLRSHCREPTMFRDSQCSIFDKGALTRDTFRLRCASYSGLRQTGPPSSYGKQVDGLPDGQISKFLSSPICKNISLRV